MGTRRRGPGAYRPPRDLWDQQKGKLYWTVAALFAVVLAIWIAEWTILADE